MGNWSPWGYWLPFTTSPTSVGGAGGGACGARSPIGTCYPGDVSMLPVPGPPWQNTVSVIPVGDNTVDVPAWCAPQDGVLPRW